METQNFQHIVSMMDRATLDKLYQDFSVRLAELEKRKDTPITSGRINELQLCMIHIQTLILNTI